MLCTAIYVERSFHRVRSAAPIVGRLHPITILLREDRLTSIEQRLIPIPLYPRMPRQCLPLDKPAGGHHRQNSYPSRHRNRTHKRPFRLHHHNRKANPSSLLRLRNRTRRLRFHLRINPIPAPSNPYHAGCSLLHKCPLVLHNSRSSNHFLPLRPNYLLILPSLGSSDHFLLHKHDQILPMSSLSKRSLKIRVRLSCLKNNYLSRLSKQSR